MPRRSLWVIFITVLVSLACYQRADRNPYGRWFAEALETIDRHYLEPVDDQKLFEGALDGMVHKLDDYSAFVPVGDTPQFQQSLDQQYGGIGIEVSLEGPDKELTIKSPLAGTPAFEAGLKAGDRIVAVEGKPIRDVPLREIVKMLRGKPGEPVNLSVRRAGNDQPLEFRLVRALIKMDSVAGFERQPDGKWDYFLPGHDGLGYLRIEVFGEQTVADFESAMRGLIEKKCRGLVLDLRNNPGGLLQAAERICDLFVPAGAVIVSTRGRDARERNRYVGSGNGPYQNLPMVVLVNDKSASAAEIVAACLQDHHRAAIVGERSFGKGTVQNVIPLEGGKSLLKLTIASYWRPSGKNIHRLKSSQLTDDWGVRPDPGCEVAASDKPPTPSPETPSSEKPSPEKASPEEPSESTPPAAEAPPAPASAETGTAAPPATGEKKLEQDRQLRRAVEVLEQRIAPTEAPKHNAA